MVLLALAVSACTGPSMGSQPSGLAPTSVPARPSSTSSTVTPSASTSSPAAATRPAIPAAARAHTAAGAEAFARFYFSELNRAWTIPDPFALSGLSSPTCKTCTNFALTARSLQKDGFRYDGPPVSVGDSILLPESNKNRVALQFINVQEARSIVNSQGRVIEKLPRRSSLSQLEMIWSAQGWHVDRFRAVVPS